MNNLDKYGLTNQFKALASQFEDLTLARVIAQQRGSYTLATETDAVYAEISGKFRFENERLESLPAVGDFVLISQENADSVAIIHTVLNRKSSFLRTSVGNSNENQVVASNIDTVFICMSLNNNFNLSRLERYLGVAWDSGAIPVIVLTKSDLCDDLDIKIAEVQGVASFSDIITLSKFDTDVIDKFSKFVKNGTTSAFIGSSGVGKSTIVNILLGEDVLTTKEIGKGDKGRHTTTGREMFVSPFGGVIIDTPGMRELGADSVDLEKTFDDIETLAEQCKFSNCTHTSEPGCAIIAAIENGTLEQRRLDNYNKLKIEVGYEGLSSKEIEVQKTERMFKDVGGMKNMRDFMKSHKKGR